MAKKATAPSPVAKPASKAPPPAKAASKRTAVTKAAEAPPPDRPVKPAVMNNKQLADQLAERQDLPTKQALALFDGVVDLLVDRLKAGDKLRLKGLGILEVKDRPARTGRNPATGAPIQIAASKKIAFRPAKELKDAL